MKIKLLLLFLLLPLIGFTQEKVTINGYIKDASNGESLIGATVYIRSASVGATTNVYGFYSLTLPAGTYDVEFTYVGYAKQLINKPLSSNVRLDIEMVPEGEELEEIVISAEKDQSS